MVENSETLKGGIGGGLAGLTVGFVGVYAATARYPAFRSLTLPLKAFLVTSAGTFAGKSDRILVDQTEHSINEVGGHVERYKIKKNKRIVKKKVLRLLCDVLNHRKDNAPRTFLNPYSINKLII